MVSFLNNSPSVVRDRTRSQHKVQRFDFDVAEGGDDIPRSILSFYKYKRNRGQPKSEALVNQINWPVPLSFSEPNSLSYESYNLGMLGNSTDRIRETLSSSVKRGVSLFDQGDYTEMANRAMQMGLEFFATAPISRDTDLGRYLQLQQGIVVNPHATVLFNSVPLRRFTLNWRFSPRSIQNAEKLLQQLQVVRENIYPEENESGFALRYPYLCTVTFPNSKLTDIRKSFVENMTINNSSGNSIEFYRDGTPTDYEVTMSFVETEIITRDILQGKQRSPLASTQEVLDATSSPPRGTPLPRPGQNAGEVG